MYIGVCEAYKVSLRTHYATAHSKIYINESVIQLQMRAAQCFRHEERVRERERDLVRGERSAAIITKNCLTCCDRVMIMKCPGFCA